MKIVHIALTGPVSDGWNYQENLIPKYQALDGHDVTVIASKWIFSDKGSIALFDKTDYEFDGFKMIRLDMTRGKNIHSKFKKYSGLYEKLCEIEPEIIFIHNVSFLDINQVTKYAKKHKVTIYADNHNDFSNSGRNFLSKNILHKIIWRYGAQRIEKYVKLFYGVLPARVDFLVNVYGLPKEKVKLLVMGADDEFIEKISHNNSSADVRKAHNISDDDFLIMTGGKIDLFKTQTISLMEAVKSIENPKVKLIVFGSVVEELKEQVNSLADGQKIQYKPWLSAEESYAYFGACQLAVFPGRHSVYWEQVAGMGIPMICKYWDGTTHVDNGGNVKFLNDDSTLAIRDEILRLIENPAEYEKMLEVAKEKSNVFSYKSIAKRSIEMEDN